MLEERGKLIWIYSRWEKYSDNITVQKNYPSFFLFFFVLGRVCCQWDCYSTRSTNVIVVYDNEKVLLCFPSLLALLRKHHEEVGLHVFQEAARERVLWVVIVRNVVK